MTYLLFHGRHIIQTTFQEKYLSEALSLPIEKLQVFEGVLPKDDKITHVIFAVTSANKANSRFNPLPLYLRTISIDRFFKPIHDTLGVTHSIVPVPHFDPTDKYVELLLKEIKEVEHIDLTPENTVVLASTPFLINMYHSKGFSVLTAEYNLESKSYIATPPTKLVEKLSGLSSWDEDTSFVKQLAASTISFWRDYTIAPKLIQSIWKEPLLTESGSLTETRNYSTYAAGMGHTELLDLKYKDIKGAIIPGRIVDEGCADGALMTKITHDFPDSDVIGIEITSEFLARCHERQRAGEFGGTFVFFHQRNLMDQIFEDESIDTTICNSTTHEIWSYGNKEESLQKYITLKYKQTKQGGRLIIRDVVGPEHKEQEVYMHLNSDDGSNNNIFENPTSPEDFSKHIAGLSTEARFYRFAKEYLGDMRKKGKRGDDTKIVFTEKLLDGKKFFVLRLKDAVEFMTKKDYVDNFISELNEEFAFFSFTDWKGLLLETGFTILENQNESTITSRAYSNPWIVEHRFKGKVDLYIMQHDILTPYPYPPTNMVLVAEK
ncbi:MAG: methyltransferase domain-containing protein [Patescibacteria group bacterium]